MQETVIDWLLASSFPWVKYHTMMELLNYQPGNTQVIQARREMINHPFYHKLEEELAQWPGTVLNSHKSAGQPFHKLFFLADLGATRADSAVNRIMERVFSHSSDEGPFTLPMTISESYGGSGKEVWAWALCDAPIIVYALLRMGYQDYPQVKKAVKYLMDLTRNNGWPCVVSRQLGRFRGPGKKGDPCPYATLVMLKMLSQTAEYSRGEEAHIGTETLLSLWELSRKQHPYLFYMGTDFRKLKAPFIWYDILHVTDVLSSFPWVYQDQRFQEMVNLILSKADDQGFYTPESVWMAWKSWDFGQKKTPSPWLTFLVLRMQKRIHEQG